MQRQFRPAAPASHDASSPRRLGIIGLVVVLHAVLIYAIVTGLATRLVLEVPNVLNAEVLPQTQPDVPPPPPPPMPKLEQPVLPAASAPAIVIRSQPAPARAITVTVMQGPPRMSPLHGAAAAPVALPVAAPPALPTAAQAVAGTHTIPPYPDLSRRLGEHGTVTLRIDIAADGRIGAVAVENSSGNERLDAAAVNWVQSRWRYRPATEGGKPVAATVRADIVFDLRNTR